MFTNKLLNQNILKLIQNACFFFQFTDELPQLSPDNPDVIARIDQSEFDGFEYVNPLQMSREDSV